MRLLKFKVYYQKITANKWIEIGIYSAEELAREQIEWDPVRCKMVQYIGQEDRHGIAIYEQDIIKVEGDRTYAGEVVYNEEVCQYELNDRLKGRIIRVQIDSTVSQYGEVVGNTFQDLADGGIVKDASLFLIGGNKKVNNKVLNVYIQTKKDEEKRRNEKNYN